MILSLTDGTPQGHPHHWDTLRTPAPEYRDTQNKGFWNTNAGAAPLCFEKNERRAVDVLQLKR